ncbi:MAG: electron transport complex subunit RsxC, partial [Gammaproteobacteria bacterium]|nr:electron transport complex subunit RsxC [Gammaproteobacteria bacterium]
MRLLGLKTFRHGVHPPEHKEGTAGMPIRQFPFAPQLIVPLSQHAG